MWGWAERGKNRVSVLTCNKRLISIGNCDNWSGVKSAIFL